MDAVVLLESGDDHLQAVASLRAEAGAAAEVYAAGGLFPVLPLETKVEGLPSAIHQDGPLTAYPNPATDRVTLAYTLPQAGAARLAVYDVLGREVAVADAGMRSADRHRTALDVSALPAGFYVAVLEAEGVRETARFTVAR